MSYAEDMQMLRGAQSADDPGKVWASLLLFCVSTAILIVLAHAVAYMTHEYSHSFTAWALGWMANPFALDYGHLTLNNVLFLGDVGDNVNYEPIFASGHGIQAAIIALAGMVIGNAALYLLLYALAMKPWISASPVRLSMVFWLSLMCAGNVWSYVPVRALTTHADIALAARGFGVSLWVQFPFVLIPSLCVVWHFFSRMCARCFLGIADQSSARSVMMTALTAYWFFVFFVGDAAGGDYGLISQVIAILSKYIMFPIASVWLWQHHGRSPARPA